MLISCKLGLWEVKGPYGKEVYFMNNSIDIVKHLTGTYDMDSSEFYDALDRVLAKYAMMEKAMKTFVLRCEEGSIRSRKTYASFKSILDT